MAISLAVATSETVRVPDDECCPKFGGMLECGGEFGTAVIVVGRDVFLRVDRHDLVALPHGEGLALLDLVGDRAAFIWGRLRRVDDRRPDATFSQHEDSPSVSAPDRPYRG